MKEHQIENILKNYHLIKAEVEINPNSEDTEKAKEILKKTELAVSRLPESIEQVIELLYFERLTWIKTELELHISQNTLNRYRKLGIKMITDIFNGSNTRKLLNSI